MEVSKEIQDSLQKCGIRRDVDVWRISLTRKKLTGVPDLSRFHFLRKLWLNNNKIRELSCRSLNCCLTELYLQNNNIKSISGALNHLTCLRLLFLHNNQIRGLDDTVHELRKMQQLQTAKVKSVERRRSFQMHSQDRHRVLQSVAFGRRVS
ncbi:leucine-rich repeat-containing protein 72 isoform X2 [Thunnus maccoyii]|uniref:leucine-rich repeat-containing protein 72 isoform X2 n=1 Tax=Thunnus maccoyii TaxID=8240 RepID=UPI001C4C10C7|nr:leucine-rich repeat-containing protein 72 isoform X2 [Thunnus maccoyii]